jgi:hypothetical protein
MKCMFEILMQKLGEKVFASCESGTRIFVKLVVIMGQTIEL